MTPTEETHPSHKQMAANLSSSCTTCVNTSPTVEQGEKQRQRPCLPSMVIELNTRMSSSSIKFRCVQYMPESKFDANLVSPVHTAPYNLHKCRPSRALLHKYYIAKEHNSEVPQMVFCEDAHHANLAQGALQGLGQSPRQKNPSHPASTHSPSPPTQPPHNPTTHKPN